MEGPQSPQMPQMPQMPQRKRRRSPWLFIGCGGLGCLVLVLGALFLAGMFVHLSGGIGGRIALVRVEGVITGSAGGFLGGAANSDRLVRVLRKVARDANVGAVVLRVDSPGGSAAGSQEIYDEILRVKKAGKPVVVSMGDVAASGGYYVSCAADKIIASPGTITGSIGVIMSAPELSGLLKKIGWNEQVIKSGPHKDMGSFARPLTPEEKKIVQDLINDIYDQFVTAVAEGRTGKLTRAQVVRLADGRVYTGRQAKKLGLVDDLGNLRHAIREAARLGGLREGAAVVEYGRVGLLDALLGGLAESRSPFRRAGLLYSPLADSLVRSLQ